MPAVKVLVTGCFDVVHAGHVHIFNMARKLNNSMTWVMAGLNSDESVRRLKGPARPVHTIKHRLAVVGALRAVDETFCFLGLDASQAILEKRPTYWVKGDDYCWESLTPEEREACHVTGCEVILVRRLENLSTTQVLKL